MDTLANLGTFLGGLGLLLLSFGVFWRVSLKCCFMRSASSTKGIEQRR